MASSTDFMVRQLEPNDVALVQAMMTVFGEAFNDVDTHTGTRPSTRYLERLLGGPHLIALAALRHSMVETCHSVNWPAASSAVLGAVRSGSRKQPRTPRSHYPLLASRRPGIRAA
jgi:hypothetical protein